MVPPPQPSPPPPPTQGAQYAQQFLSNILSQRGPTSLPYAEDVKWLIRQHLVSLIEIYPSLHTKTATFTHNDGRTVNLLQSEGTIPMLYQDIVYNIPIIIWLMETYPRHPPFVYVAPTRDMIIKRAHPHVSPSGLVSIPYIHTWVFPSSNLLDLARNLSHTFARDPPLYTKTPRPNPNPNPNTYSTGRFPPSTHRPADDPAEVYRRNAINKLVESLRGDGAAMRKSREAEVESLFAAQAALRQREEELAKGLREMMEEKEGLEQQLQVVLMNSDVLEAWVRENGEKGARKGSVEIDEVFELGDALSKQMVECSAADLAVEDVVYSLDKAVWEGSIAVDAYLRSIRSLSREQFFHRATAAKVRATQMQAHVTSMAARATLYGV